MGVPGTTHPDSMVAAAIVEPSLVGRRARFRRRRDAGRADPRLQRDRTLGTPGGSRTARSSRTSTPRASSSSSSASFVKPGRTRFATVKSGRSASKRVGRCERPGARQWGLGRTTIVRPRWVEKTSGGFSEEVAFRGARRGARSGGRRGGHARGHRCRSAGPVQGGLVSDVGRFNDKGFNQLQLKGLKFGATKISGFRRRRGVAFGGGLPAELRDAARERLQHLIGAGFLLADPRRTRSRRSSRTRSTRSSTTR